MRRSKKKIIQDPPPPPSSERQISLQGRRGVRGLVPLFYFANLISLYFLRGGVRPPYPPLDPRMGIDGTQVVLIIYPQQVSIHSFIWILYLILLYHLKKKILFNSMLFVSIYCMHVESLRTNILHNRFRASVILSRHFSKGFVFGNYI